MSLNHARVDRLMQVYWPDDFADYYSTRDPWQVEPIDYVPEIFRPVDRSRFGHQDTQTHGRFLTRGLA